MMKVWITCFIVLFGAAELLQWMKQFSLPLPIFILGGAFLAVASNYDKLTNLPFHPDHEASGWIPPESDQKASHQNESHQNESHQNESSPKAMQSVSSGQSRRPISFVIPKPHQSRD